VPAQQTLWLTALQHGNHCHWMFVTCPRLFLVSVAVWLVDHTTGIHSTLVFRWKGGYWLVDILRVLLMRVVCVARVVWHDIQHPHSQHRSDVHQLHPAAGLHVLCLCRSLQASGSCQKGSGCISVVVHKSSPADCIKYVQLIYLFAQSALMKKMMIPVFVPHNLYRCYTLL